MLRIDERMPRVGADAVDAFAEVEAVQAVAVGLVVLEADERQRADVDLLRAAVGLLDREGQVEAGCVGVASKRKP